MLSIKTNLSSFIAQQSIQNSTQKLNNAIEQMTSGYKINHAKDNAANFSISTNLTTRMSSYQVAEDNASMGLNMLSTIEEDLDLISDKLSRLRELSMQALNGTYGKTSLNAIYTEGDSIINEIRRILNTSEFNGKTLLGKNVGPDMTKMRTNEEGFIEDVEKRDTSSMKNIGSVDENLVLAQGTYSILTADDLAKLARMQNSGKITQGSEFVLGDDIDLVSFSSWTPIGWENNTPDTTRAFSGTFDGNGYTISNLKNTGSGSNAIVGLFGSADNAVFKNIGIEDVEMSGLSAGALVAIVKSGSEVTIENCYGKNINISCGVGGCAGGLTAGVNDMYNNTNQVINLINSYVESTSIHVNSWGAVGGIVGKTQNLIAKNCYSQDISIIDPLGFNGGISGYTTFSGNIENCYAIGTIKSNDGSGAGITGGDVTIKNCLFEGTIIAKSAGGIHSGCFGANPVTIVDCSVNARIEANGRFAGISGWLDCAGGIVKNCDFNGELVATDPAALVGVIAGGGVEDILKIEDCTYNNEKNQGIAIIADDLGIVSNVKDRQLKTTLQIGIMGDSNSQLQFDSLLELDDLKTISKKGLKNNDTLKLIDNLSSKISNIKTDYGAISNRLESAIEEISIQYENLASSRSTIRDADIAEVSAEYIQQQILQQASATLMSTANQSPMVALQLL